MTFRPGPLRAAAILAAGFVAARVVYRILFHGADAGGAVLLDLPELRLPAPFAHVVLLGPVTSEGLWDAAASALPIALTIVAFGAVNAVVDMHRVFARASRRGPLRGIARAIAIAAATLPSLAEGARAVRFAQRLRGERGGARMLLPLLQRTLERAGAVAAALELRGFAGRGLSGECLQPVAAEGVEIGWPDGGRAAATAEQGAERGIRVPSLTLAPGTLTVVAGPTGSGKTTLLRAIAGLHTHTDGGWISGSLRVVGHDRVDVPPRDLAQRVGVVLQNPREAFATERVRDEIGLALELRGVADVIVAARVTEVAERVGIAGLLDRPTRALSAGEATLVAIAAAIVEHPILLLVDEPLADLDAAARTRIAALLGALAHDAGMCVVVAEHRVEGLAGVADEVLRVEQGRVEASRLLMRSPGSRTHDRTDAAAGPVQSGRLYDAGASALQARGVTVAHGGTVAVAGADLDLRAGEIVALVGPNGAGKSSLLAALALPERGARVTAAGRVALIPDASDDLFVCDTVAAECARADRRAGRGGRGSRRAGGTAERFAGTAGRRAGARAERFAGTAERFAGRGGTTAERFAGTAGRFAGRSGVTAERFAGFLGLDVDGAGLALRLAQHPRDLSAGERRCLALAIQLSRDPVVILVDEPTRGLDPAARATVWAALSTLAADGTAVLVASHEPEVAAHAARVLEMRAGVLAARADAGAGAYRVQENSGGSPGKWVDVTAETPILPELGTQMGAREGVSSRVTRSTTEGSAAASADRALEMQAGVLGARADAGAGAYRIQDRPEGSAGNCADRGAETPALPEYGTQEGAREGVSSRVTRSTTGGLGTARVHRGGARAGLLALAAANLVALGAFCWPFVATALPSQAQAAVPVAALALVPLAAFVVVATLDGTVRSAHLLALLGTLAAIGAAVRIASTGVGGVEAVFILLILAGRAFGVRFGLLLGMATIALSTLITGTFGPWTPFQMFACAWVGAGAALLPRRVGPTVEIALLCVYGVVASYAFGLLMNLWFWPFAVGYGTGISYDAGAPFGDNLASFVLYSLVTSTLSWDTLRAITSVIGIVVIGRPVLAALRRAKPLRVANRGRVEASRAAVLQP